MTEAEEWLNRLAQGRTPLEGGRAWFRSAPPAEQTAILQTLAAILQQAHPRADEVERAVALSGLKPTATPAVLLQKGVIREQLAKIVHLPTAEAERSFVLFIHLLGVSDRRRREEECSGGCSHAWHRLR